MTNPNDPILYRIMDFFEFVALVRSSTLRVSRATRFSDSNELVGAYLSFMDNPSFHPYSDDEMAKAISRHQRSKQQYFVSSWTMNRNSIAMWELYSPNACGIQIGVRKSVIKYSFDTFSDKHSYVLGHNAPADDGRVLFYPTFAGLCEYVSFDEMLETLQSRYRVFSAELSANLGDPASFQKTYEEITSKRSVDFQKALFFKDRAYRHEEEYRFALQGVTRNSRPYNECLKDPLNCLLDTHLRPITTSDAGENIFIPFDTAAVEEIWMDGRLPVWKQQVLIALLSEYGLRAEVSKAYGSFFEQHDIKPMK